MSGSNLCCTLNMKEAIAKLYIASNGSMLASKKSGNERVLCGLLNTSLTAFF